MAGAFRIKSFFNLNMVFLSRLQTRWQARNFIREVHKVREKFEKYEAVTMTHDLSQVEDVNKFMVQHGGSAIREWFALTTNIFLWLDSIVKKFPNTEFYISHFDEVKKIYESLKKKLPPGYSANEIKEIIDAVDKAKKDIIHGRQELLKKAQAELHEDYRKLVTLISAADENRGDRSTFMDEMINLWKRESTSVFDYFFIRGEVRQEIKDFSRIARHRKIADEATRKLTKIIANNGKGYDAQTILKFIDQINKATTEMLKEAIDGFTNGTKAGLRGMIVMFSMVAYLNRLYKEEEHLAEQHEVPLAMAQEMEQEIKKMIKDVHQDAKYETSGLNAVRYHLESMIGK